MPLTTPHADNHNGLAELASRYVNVDALPWEATRFTGIEVKTLMTDPDSGYLTTLVRMAPGAVLPDHEHTEVEQTYVIQGALVDDEGEASGGQLAQRLHGSGNELEVIGVCEVVDLYVDRAVTV